MWRKRKAILLLCFGVVSGITCTDAILSAVKQEAVVVQLAQQLVAHEVRGRRAGRRVCMALPELGSSRTCSKLQAAPKQSLAQCALPTWSQAPPSPGSGPQQQAAMAAPHAMQG